MSYGLFLAVIVAAVVALFLKGIYEERKKEAAFLERLAASYGKVPWGYEKKAPSPGHKGSHKSFDRRNTDRYPDGYLQYLCRREDRFFLDEITWKELDMEAVFARLDYTMSQVGREYLYAMLHRPAQNQKDAEKWEKAASYFASHSRERVKIQGILAKIGRGKGLSCYDCLEAVREAPKGKVLKEYAADMAYVAGVFLFMLSLPSGLAFLAFVMVYQIVTYFGERAKILACLLGVAGLLRMIKGAEVLYRSLPDEIRQQTEQELGFQGMDCFRKLRSLRRHSFWVLQCGREGSSPVSVFADYIRMLLHPDVIQFQLLRNKILSLEPELWNAFAFTGYMDGSISIAMYRGSLDYYSIPALYCAKDDDRRKKSPCPDTDFYGEECFHPLLEIPVANSIRMKAGHGILLTGSNASGKSTFLKTIAVNLLFAQTIDTVLARTFQAPFCRIFTAMQDDGGSIQRGESSYMAEILSLKRILDAGKEMQAPVFCFIDEILRGTNTVERISASTQILRSIRQPEMYCFAATHDRELTELLGELYDNYHFTEEVQGKDISFSYRLQRGSADTSNAIRLLDVMGYDREIVEQAIRQAENFLREGVWK